MGTFFLKRSNNWQQTADKAIDGVVDGWPGDYTKEWASAGEGNGAWLQLNFSQAYSVNKVVMYDRPGSRTQVLGAELTFNSGSPVSVGTLDNGGAATTVTFSARTITWMRFTVTNSAGTDVGLAEIEVWQAAAKNADVSDEDDFSPANPEVSRQFCLSPTYPNLFSPHERGTFGSAVSRISN